MKPRKLMSLGATLLASLTTGAVVQADDSALPNEVVETEATPVHVTEQDVNQVRTERDQLVEQVDTTNAQLTAENQKLAEIENNRTELESQIQKGEDADTIVADQNKVITTAETDKTQKETEVTTLDTDKAEAEKELAERQTELDAAENLRDQKAAELKPYESIKEPTAKELKDNADTIKRLTQEESDTTRSLAEKENELNRLETQDATNQPRKAELQAEESKLTKALNQKKAERDTLTSEITSLETRLAEGYKYPLNFGASPEWIRLYNEMVELGREKDPTDADRRRIVRQFMNDEITEEEFHRLDAELDKRRQEWFSDLGDRVGAYVPKLVAEEQKNPFGVNPNDFPETPDEVYQSKDLVHMDKDLLLELNHYFVYVLNQAQEKLNSPRRARVNTDLIKFATEVATEYQTNNYTGTGHFGRGINNVARKRGLSTTAGPGVDTQNQYYENLMTYGFADDYELKGTMTRSQLFRRIYGAINFFFMEGEMTGHYRHAASLRNAQSLGLAFSYTQGLLRIHVIQGDKRSLTEWETNWGHSAPTTLPFEDLSTNGVDRNHLETLKTNRDTLNATISTEEGQLTKVTTELSSLNAVTTKLAETRQDVTTTRNRLTTIQAEKQQAENDKTRLDKEVADANEKKATRTRLQGELATLNREVTQKETRRNEARNSRDAIVNRINTLQEEVEVLNQTIQGATEKRDEAQIPQRPSARVEKSSGKTEPRGHHNS